MMLVMNINGILDGSTIRGTRMIGRKRTPTDYLTIDFSDDYRVF
jgi:hypothetical protein